MITIANPSPDPTAGKPPRRKRWIPLSLRMFMAILVLLGVSSVLWTWVSYHRAQQVYHREQQVIQEIKSWGGIVSTKTDGPEWLPRLVGNGRQSVVRVFDRISFILLDRAAVTDAGVARFHLSGLTNLDGVSLDGTAVTDASLAQLSGLTKLRQVSVNGTAVTDAGLMHLNGLTGLKMLRLTNTKVTDAGVAELQRGLPELEITK